MFTEEHKLNFKCSLKTRAGFFSCLFSEMELMIRNSSHMSSMQEEKRAVQLELKGLENVQRGE